MTKATNKQRKKKYKKIKQTKKFTELLPEKKMLMDTYLWMYILILEDLHVHSSHRYSVHWISYYV